MELRINWMDDCQGKKDYDGELIIINSEFSPSKCSAECKVIMTNGYDNKDQQTLIEHHFQGDSFDSVSSQVEEWAQTQADRVYKAILKEFWNE